MCTCDQHSVPSRYKARYMSTRLLPGRVYCTSFGVHRHLLYPQQEVHTMRMPVQVL